MSIDINLRHNRAEKQNRDFDNLILVFDIFAIKLYKKI